MEKKEEIIEWYDSMDQHTDHPGEPAPPIPISIQSVDQFSDKPEKKEDPKKTVDRIEKGAELHKVIAMSKALNDKLVLLSGTFDNPDASEKQDSIKDEVKEIARRILKIIEEL